MHRFALGSGFPLNFGTFLIRLRLEKQGSTGMGRGEGGMEEGRRGTFDYSDRSGGKVAHS